METIYLCIIIFLFVLAVFDLIVGVSNDAVNFLNSAVGAKAASFKTILFIAGVGIFIGASLSNGMMDIARHGIYQPEHFYFAEIMCILLAVMLTDVVLLDVFNSMGMPTSTTVSLVFELLGGTFALSLIKVHNSDTLGLGDLINTDKALSVIMAIFVSVAIAFFFGMLVQWLARVIFTFNYTKKMKYSIALFGGIAATAIIYFMLIKGLKDSSFMTPENKHWIQDNTLMLITVFFVFFTVLMQILHWMKINVFKVIVLMGTFALALAFAGNDLVNFIGVPLAGFSSFMDYTANGGGNPNGFLMTSLLGPAKTPWYFLIGAGAVMVYALCTSKKAHAVIKTSVDLSRQDEGEETFGSTPIARTVVRISMTLANGISRIMPSGSKEWFDSRFRKDEAIIADGAAFDLVRASVNLVLAGLLIALGTSLKLPLSTTYVTFIVAMGSSLADRAWSRESAVFRITGVLNVIGGWFLTAGIAFSACALVTIAMYYGGAVVMALFVFVAVFILIKSNFSTKRKEEADYEEQLFKGIMNAKDKAECWGLLKKHVCATQQEMLDFVWKTYEDVVNGFVDEDLKTLRRAVKRIDAEKSRRKKLRQRELVGMRRIDKRISLEKNTWFHLASNSGEQMLYCLKRMSEPCKEHVDNNFNPLSRECVEEILPVKKKIVDYLMRSERIVEDQDYEHIDALLAEEEAYKQKLSEMRRAQEDRIQMDLSQGLKVSLVYLNLLQETQELLSDLRHYLRAFKRFQQ